jgi:hypothetical protein
VDADHVAVPEVVIPNETTEEQVMEDKLMFVYVRKIASKLVWLL